MAFIPARVNKPFIALFRVYVKHLFRRRFKRVYLENCLPSTEQGPVIFFMNHHLWWDGLIPLLLNEYEFRKEARAIMEIDQMKEFRFFSWIGAFSVDLKGGSDMRTTIRYAVDHLATDNPCLFIFPEGKITPYTSSDVEFEQGLAFISTQSPQSKVVPVCSFLDVSKNDKPDLYLHVGNPVKLSTGLKKRSERTAIFENTMTEVQQQVRRRVFEEQTGPEGTNPGFRRFV